MITTFKLHQAQTIARSLRNDLRWFSVALYKKIYSTELILVQERSFCIPSSANSERLTQAAFHLASLYRISVNLQTPKS